MSIPPDYASILSEIKNKLELQQMSALVGAGFSKNFNEDIFPSWWQLLRDMVYETQGHTIQQSFNNLPKIEGQNEISYMEYLNNQLDRYIESIGPLKAVSEYIVKKGYREAADYKIEEATPVLDVKNGKRYISYRKEGVVTRREVLSEELRVHEKFVSLNWNNIYTTNYDNLLENSIDFQIKDGLDAQVSSLMEQLEERNLALGNINIKIQELQDNLDMHKAEDAMNSLVDDAILADSAKEQINVSELGNELKHKCWTKKGIEADIESLNEEFRAVSALNSDFSSLVRNSSDLALKKNGNIIKIHGSLRTDDYKDYGFDGDIRKHYIISQEDFDTYPQKHEAFAQLMRIALLQESFCIIGFSGIDPNFLAWIEWVRDVIQQRDRDGKIKDKIYLINIDKNPHSADRELFYRNHGIIVVPLRHQDCIVFLEAKLKRTVSANATNKELVELFVDYLYFNGSVNRFRAAFERSKQQKYKDLLRTIPRAHTKEFKQANDKLIGQVNQIITLKAFSRIPDLRWDRLINQYYYIRGIEPFLSRLRGAKRLELIRLILGFIQDQLIPLSILFIDTGSTFLKLKKATERAPVELQNDFQLLLLKDSVLRNDEIEFQKIATYLSNDKQIKITQELSFQAALSALYNLEFTKFYKLMERWEASGVWVLKKAGLIAINQPHEAANLLEKNIPTELSEQLFYFERIIQFSGFSPGNQRKQYQKRIKELEEKGFSSSSDSIKHIFERLTKETKVINPYGHGKFIISRTHQYGGPVPFLDSIQLLNYLQEVGLPAGIINTRFFEPHQVHKVFESLYETYPYPVLTALCQYGDDKLTQRLAQDYAYSTELVGQITSISNAIQKGCLDQSVPPRFKIQLLIFYAELINVVEIEHWEDFFVKIWKEEKHQKVLFSDNKIGSNLFIRSALKYIEKISTQLMVIDDCLEALVSSEEHDINPVIQRLYDFAMNKSREKQTDLLAKAINQNYLQVLIARLPKFPDLLFVLGNIDYLINTQLRKKILNAIDAINSFELASERLWRIYFHFTKNDNKIKNKLKKKLLENKRLWDAGFIDEQTTTSSNSFISLYGLRSRIDWNMVETKKIYERLVLELGKIERQTFKKSNEHNYSSILAEMLWFMKYEEPKISKLPSYYDVLLRVRNLHSNQREFINLTSGLISKDDTVVILAINELSYRLHNFGNLEEQDEYLKLVLNKLILKSPGRLAATFGTFTDWLIHFKDADYFKSLRPLIEKLVEVYAFKENDEFDMPFLEENIIQIAFVLNQWGSEGQNITELLNLLNTSRFNSTKHHLKYIIDKINAKAN